MRTGPATLVGLLNTRSRTTTVSSGTLPKSSCRFFTSTQAFTPWPENGTFEASPARVRVGEELHHALHRALDLGREGNLHLLLATRAQREGFEGQHLHVGHADRGPLHAQGGPALVGQAHLHRLGGAHRRRAELERLGPQPRTPPARLARSNLDNRTHSPPPATHVHTARNHHRRADIVAASQNLVGSVMCNCDAHPVEPSNQQGKRAGRRGQKPGLRVERKCPVQGSRKNFPDCPSADGRKRPCFTRLAALSDQVREQAASPAGLFPRAHRPRTPTHRAEPAAPPARRGRARPAPTRRPASAASPRRPGPSSRSPWRR